MVGRLVGRLVVCLSVPMVPWSYGPVFCVLFVGFVIPTPVLMLLLPHRANDTRVITLEAKTEADSVTFQTGKRKSPQVESHKVVTWVEVGYEKQRGREAEKQRSREAEKQTHVGGSSVRAAGWSRERGRGRELHLSKKRQRGSQETKKKKKRQNQTKTKTKADQVSSVDGLMECVRKERRVTCR